MSAAHIEPESVPVRRHLNNAHDDETLTRIVELSERYTYGQIATMLGLKSRNVVAGIVHRASRGLYPHVKVMGADLVRRAKDAKRQTREEMRNQRDALALARMERKNAKRRAERALAAAARAADSAARQKLSKRPMDWAEREALRAEADRLPVRRLTLMEIGRGDCHWPLTETPGTLFCALPASPGKPYCDCHQAVAYRGFQR